MPMAVPSTKAQSTGVMPMKRDKRAPMISRVSMSRPSSSLPSGKPAVPIGLSRWSIDDWYGSAGASHGPNSASSNSSNTTLAAPTATGARRRRSPTPAQEPRGGPGGKAGGGAGGGRGGGGGGGGEGGGGARSGGAGGHGVHDGHGSAAGRFRNARCAGRAAFAAHRPTDCARRRTAPAPGSFLAAAAGRAGRSRC